LLSYLLKSTQLPEFAIKNTLKLLNEDCTIPFIARYRKEATGNLDEVQLEQIVKLKAQFEALEKRKAAILKALKEQEVLTSDLQSKITTTQDLTTLEDLYLPYKKKRKTKAEKARQQGLESLAKMIMSQNARDLDSLAQRYVTPEVLSYEQALEGARHIIAEWINERSDIRSNLRYQLGKFAMIETKVIKAQEREEKAQKFRRILKSMSFTSPACYIACRKRRLYPCQNNHR